MARYAAVNQVRKVEELKRFDSDGYEYDASASSEQTWVFRRDKN